MSDEKDLKPKEPLLAVMLACMLNGLGHIYVGRIYRGLFFFCIPVMVGLFASIYVHKPETTTSLGLFGAYLFGLWFWNIYSAVDTYLCAKSFNKKHDLQRNITPKNRNLFIAGIVLVVVGLNPFRLVTWGMTSYFEEFYVKSYKLSATSMSMTLLDGDILLIDKRIYKKSDPQRGDIVFFIYPEDRKNNLIQRIVGLPNETVEIKDGAIFINGNVLSEPEIFQYTNYNNIGTFGQAGLSVTVPSNSYFVLGDNSMSSEDSRIWGFVDHEDVLGKVYKLIFPFERSGPIK